MISVSFRQCVCVCVCAGEGAVPFADNALYKNLYLFIAIIPWLLFRGKTKKKNWKTKFSINYFQKKVQSIILQSNQK
jgi:hypothetical protein